MFEPLSIFANIEQLLRKRNICGKFDKPFKMRLQVSVFDNLVFVEWSFPGTLIVRRHSRKGRLCWRAPHKLGKKQKSKKAARAGGCAARSEACSSGYASGTGDRVLSGVGREGAAWCTRMAAALQTPGCRK